MKANDLIVSSLDSVYSSVRLVAASGVYSGESRVYRNLDIREAVGGQRSGEGSAPDVVVGPGPLLRFCVSGDVFYAIEVSR
eukprot:scaffold203963_cov38-Tisochrysis_lutea.AAC.1